MSRLLLVVVAIVGGYLVWTTHPFGLFAPSPDEELRDFLTKFADSRDMPKPTSVSCTEFGTLILPPSAGEDAPDVPLFECSVAYADRGSETWCFSPYDRPLGIAQPHSCADLRGGEVVRKT